MQYRKLDANGDRVFGHSSGDFYVDQPEAVAQAVQTRLNLFLGEWYIDTSDGTDWMGRVLGNRTQLTHDLEIQSRILATPGVQALVSYSSQYDGTKRGLSVSAVVQTLYGPAAVAPLVASAPTVSILQQPVELTGNDGTPLAGADGALLFDPRRPVN